MHPGGKTVGIKKKNMMENFKDSTKSVDKIQYGTGSDAEGPAFCRSERLGMR